MASVRRSGGGHAALFLTCLAALLAAPAGAATFVVSNGNDAGAGSLRDAVDQANSNPGADSISFDAGVSVVGISGSQLQVTDHLNITGPGQANLRIERSAGNGRLFNLVGASGIDVTLSGLTLDGNDSPSSADGGCVQTESVNLVLQDVRMTACSALHDSDPFAGGSGGALYFDGRSEIGCGAGSGRCGLQITGSRFDGNSALDGGGALYAVMREGGALTVSGSEFSSNTTTRSSPGGFLPILGGGVAVIALAIDGEGAGALSFSDCEISNNTQGSAAAPADPGSGGGLAVQYDGETVSPAATSLTISDCRFTGNRSGEGGGGGIAVFNAPLPMKRGEAPSEAKVLAFPVLIERVTASGNAVDGNGRGGGILIDDVSPGLRKGAVATSVTIENSTLSGNNANQGGGLASAGNFGTLTLRNSTVSGNLSASEGSGLYLGGSMTVQVLHATIAANSAAGSGGGLQFAASHALTLRLQNSILDGNSDGSGANDIAFDGSPVFDLDYSLINAAPGATVDFDNAVAAGAGVLRNQSAQLGALADNGGPTLTQLPNSGSPAINAGDPAFTGASSPSTDQRGTGFARLIGGRLDMGAVETTPATPTLAATKTVSGTFLPEETFTYTITLSNSGTGAQPDNPGDEFTDVLPAGLSLNFASATSGTAVADVGTRTVTWNGAIPAGGSVTISITATINAGTAGETISNQGTVAFDGDANGSNEGSLLTDDPAVPGAANPTSFVVLNPGVLAFDPVTYTVNENVGSGTVTLTVTRSGGSAGAASVSYTTVAGSATAGSDYTTSSATLNWADGDATPRSIVVPILNDAAVEPDEQFTVALSGATGASLGVASTATVTIVSEDVPPPGVLGFDPATYTVNENVGSGTVTLTVTRSGGSAGAASVSFTTVAGSATAGSDYTTGSATLNWADGDATPRSIVVAILNDSEVEANEQFTVALSNASGASLGAASTATVTIVSDDVAPAGTLGFDPTTLSVNEDAGMATLSVTRTGGSSGAVGATCATQAGGSATAGSDYTSTSSVLNWADGDTAPKACAIPILDDSVVEGSETVQVTLSAPTGGAGIGAGSATVTILDEDNAGSLAFGAASYSVAEPGANTKGSGTLSVTVVRSGGTDGAVSVDVATSNGSAIAPGDYVALETTLTWADGVGGAQSLQVTINPDTLVEPAETFTLGLANPQGGAALGAPSTATVTIAANGTVAAPPELIPVDDPRALLALLAALLLTAGLTLGRSLQARRD